MSKFASVMEFIDSHTHNSDTAYEGVEDRIIRNALEAGVIKLVQPDIDSSERGRMLELASRYPGVLYTMLGLYPGSVTKGWKEEIDLMCAQRTSNPVSIGEIGLDYHWSTEFKEEQKEAFRVQLELASEWGLPVNIHLRDATEDFFSIIEDCRHLHLRGCLHAFSGSAEMFRRVCKSGDWYVGIGGVLTYRNAGVARAVPEIPLERIMLETDSPYLPPVPHRGERNESAYIPIIAEKLAGLKGCSVEEVAEATTENARKFYSI